MRNEQVDSWYVTLGVVVTFLILGFLCTGWLRNLVWVAQMLEGKVPGTPGQIEFGLAAAVLFPIGMINGCSMLLGFGPLY